MGTLKVVPYKGCSFTEIQEEELPHVSVSFDF